ncbi:hypothetical protein RRG08_007717 [Elysia crispata]|uniref:Uncharacterized protein n=1 Tax=Elysia crispata TaxID=231223 RepID=A0AAE1CZN5_9GAST|nr:hypothetical protein RRG08_007717 [Elysia crispata]
MTPLECFDGEDEVLSLTRPCRHGYRLQDSKGRRGISWKSSRQEKRMRLTHIFNILKTWGVLHLEPALDLHHVPSVRNETIGHY